MQIYSPLKSMASIFDSTPHNPIRRTLIKRFALDVVAVLYAGTASADAPHLAGKYGANITTDSNQPGQVRVNGKVTKLIKRPKGQITAQSAGVYIDITSQGDQLPRITYTAKDKPIGTCQILSFAPPADTAASAGHASHSERASRGHYDPHTVVKYAMKPRTLMSDCNATVTRERGGNVTVLVTRPNGRTWTIFLENGKPLGADLSQADSDMTFEGRKEGDVFMIRAGHEHYEIVEAMVFGG
ncbi:hypothetical protein [Nitrosomonas ureae]|nr:hypothetical protein [Nitrosomonas ureae]